MTNRARARRKRKSKPKRAQTGSMPDSAMSLDELPPTTDFSLHDLFQQQTMAMLERTDLSEEQKQSILVAINCPCCGGSGLSFTMKLKRRDRR